MKVQRGPCQAYTWLQRREWQGNVHAAVSAHTFSAPHHSRGTRLASTASTDSVSWRRQGVSIMVFSISHSVYTRWRARGHTPAEGPKSETLVHALVVAFGRYKDYFKIRFLLESGRHVSCQPLLAQICRQSIGWTACNSRQVVLDMQQHRQCAKWCADYFPQSIHGWAVPTSGSATHTRTLRMPGAAMPCIWLMMSGEMSSASGPDSTPAVARTLSDHATAC